MHFQLAFLSLLFLGSYNVNVGTLDVIPEISTVIIFSFDFLFAVLIDFHYSVFEITYTFLALLSCYSFYCLFLCFSFQSLCSSILTFLGAFSEFLTPVKILTVLI